MTLNSQARTTEGKRRLSIDSKRGRTMKLLHGTTSTVPLLHCGGICPELIIVILVAETRDTACYSLLFVNL